MTSLVAAVLLWFESWFIPSATFADTLPVTWYVVWQKSMNCLRLEWALHSHQDHAKLVTDLIIPWKTDSIARTVDLTEVGLESLEWLKFASAAWNSENTYILPQVQILKTNTISPRKTELANNTQQASKIQLESENLTTCHCLLEYKVEVKHARMNKSQRMSQAPIETYQWILRWTASFGRSWRESTTTERKKYLEWI